MKYTIEEFEKQLLSDGLTMDQLEEYQEKIGHWYYETDDMTLEELSEDFIEHFELSN